MNTETIIEALKRERDGYLRHGRTERAALVEAELHRLGYDAPESGSTVLVEPVETITEPSLSVSETPKKTSAPRTPKKRTKSS